MPQTTTTTATDRQTKLASNREAAEQALERLAEHLRQGRPDDLVEYLAFASKFRRYSFSNSLLIQVQRPGATRVAGFHAWKQLGRSVRKGEKGIAAALPQADRGRRRRGRTPGQPQRLRRRARVRRRADAR